MRNVVTISLPNRLLKKLVRESIDEIGKVDGRGLDAIIGAVTVNCGLKLPSFLQFGLPSL